MGGVWEEGEDMWEKVEEDQICKIFVNHNKELELYLSCVGRTLRDFRERRGMVKCMFLDEPHGVWILEEKGWNKTQVIETSTNNTEKSCWDQKNFKS